MNTQLTDVERHQLWSLMELAGSPEALRDAERHLTNLFGRRPTLWELVSELMERTGAPVPAETLARRVTRAKEVFVPIGE